MQVQAPAIDNTLTVQTAGRQTRSSGDFKSLLGNGVAPGERDLSRDEQLRQAADKLVASALIKPLLKQVQDSPFRVERFHGGQGEKAFRQRLNTVLADRITRSANFNVADAIYQKMSKQYENTIPGAAAGKQGVNANG